MKISASVKNQQGQHHIQLETNENIHSLTIAPRASGYGSSVNGGELLLLAVATCYCNDIYREAAKRGIAVQSVEVNVNGEFGAEGESATNVTYDAVVTADACQADIEQLMRDTDRIAEIHGTLRIATPVTLQSIEARSVAR